MSHSGPSGGGGAARAAYEELETLIGRLGEELATFRRRALAAEARVRALEEAQRRGEAAAAAAPPPLPVQAAEPRRDVVDAASPPADAGRVAELERENAELRSRLGAAAGRTRQILERLRFLRQQQSAAGGPR